MQFLFAPMLLGIGRARGLESARRGATVGKQLFITRWVSAMLGSILADWLADSRSGSRASSASYAFGREAMGLGDADLMIAVGMCSGSRAGGRGVLSRPILRHYPGHLDVHDGHEARASLWPVLEFGPPPRHALLLPDRGVFRAGLATRVFVPAVNGCVLEVQIMGRFWLKVWLWIKVAILALIFVYILTFSLENYSNTVKVWYSYRRQSTPMPGPVVHDVLRRDSLCHPRRTDCTIADSKAKAAMLNQSAGDSTPETWSQPQFF